MQISLRYSQAVKLGGSCSEYNQYQPIAPQDQTEFRLQIFFISLLCFLCFFVANFRRWLTILTPNFTLQFEPQHPAKLNFSGKSFEHHYARKPL
jgi:hypothetical protein